MTLDALLDQPAIDSTNASSSVVTLRHPAALVFGSGCIERCSDDLLERGVRRVFGYVSRTLPSAVEACWETLREQNVSVTLDHPRGGEPTIEDYKRVLDAARRAEADAVIGIGGGSVMDVAKLVAAQLHNDSDIYNLFGTDLVAGREVYLACVPTTSGTGSEVSPNAILLDERTQLKKGVVSRHLIPDAAYVDPTLTLALPPDLTAATALDALTHCIEAYTNRFAHRLVDHYALEGVRLISRSLSRAFDDGNDLKAREDLALGSMYGGMCLGPVNTGAVHALAYPLGGRFNIGHGVSNAILLPHVMAFNLPAAPQRYAEIAQAMGLEPCTDDRIIAQAGVERIRELSRHCEIPKNLIDLGVTEKDVDELAESAMRVTRLLRRNVREVTREDARMIYRKACS